MRRNEPLEEDSTGMCLACSRYINFDNGILLDSLCPQICKECWGKLSIAEKMAMKAQWMLLEKQTECLESITRLAIGALDGYHVPGSGEAGRN